MSELVKKSELWVLESVVIYKTIYKIKVTF
jgi:hypothetical protein